MAVMDKYFLNRNDYYFRPYHEGGLSGKKQLAVPRSGIGTSFIVKSGDRECACNEFIGLRLAKLLGINVPEGYLVLPKGNGYNVAIEYLPHQQKLSLEQVKEDSILLRSYVHGVLAHYCLFEDRDGIDFLFSRDMLFTFDFAEGFRLSDFSIMVMESQDQLAFMHSPELIAKFAAPDVEYHPSTLLAYELLVEDQAVCDKVYFDAALDEICTRFLAIPDEEISGLLNALKSLYPSATAVHFEKYINEIRKFCCE